MTLLDVLKAIVLFLWPPRAPSGDIFGSWRISISIVTMVNLFGGATFALAVFGYLTLVYPGAASENDLANKMVAVNITFDSINATLKSIQRGQLDAKLRKLDDSLVTDRKAYCQAVADKNLAAKAFAEDRFRQDYSTYFNLSNGQVWRIPDCSELI